MSGPIYREFVGLSFWVHLEKCDSYPSSRECQGPQYVKDNSTKARRDRFFWAFFRGQSNSQSDWDQKPTTANTLQLGGRAASRRTKPTCQPNFPGWGSLLGLLGRALERGTSTYSKFGGDSIKSWRGLTRMFVFCLIILNCVGNHRKSTSSCAGALKGLSGRKAHSWEPRIGFAEICWVRTGDWSWISGTQTRWWNSCSLISGFQRVPVLCN